MGVSPKEEHCSLWEKHERDTKVLTREEENLSGEKKKTPEPLLPSEQKLEEVELITPENLLPSEKKLEDKEKKTADPVSPSELNLGVKEKKTPEPLLPSEQTYPKSSVEEKDQNSNKPASYISSTDDTQKSKPSSITKLADQKVSESSGKEEGNKAEKETKEGINDKKEDATKLKDPIKIPGRPQPDMGSSSSATLDPKLPTIIKEENANTQAGLDAARNNSKQLEQNQNAIKKPESKEDMVREIKEIDSKEVRNQNGTSSPLNNVNNKSNQPSDKVANANLNQTSNESTSIKNQSGAESKLT